MNRNRSYYRKQRKRAIRRKERILLKLGGEELLRGWAHGAVGRFAKGKIHCSCPVFRLKSYEYPQIRDLRKADAADLQLREIESTDQAKELLNHRLLSNPTSPTRNNYCFVSALHQMVDNIIIRC